MTLWLSIIGNYFLMGRLIDRVRYRVGQFVKGVLPRVDEGELKLVCDLLPGDAVGFFMAMPADAQRHSLNVLYGLQNAGYADRDLAVAALLHDAGKVPSGGSPRIGLWLRGPLVLLDAFLPQLIRRLAASDPPRGWRYLFHLHLEHPRIGAEQARGAGCSPMACWLIEHHQTPAPADMPDPAWATYLAALQWADNKN